MCSESQMKLLKSVQSAAESVSWATVTTTTRSISSPGNRLQTRQHFLILALEAQRPLAAPFRVRLDGLERVYVGRGTVRSVQAVGVDQTIELADHTLSSAHVVMEREGAGWKIRDRGSKNGTFVNEVRIEQVALHDGDIVEAGSTTFVYRACDLEIVAESSMPGDLETLSPTFERELMNLQRIAVSDVPVMLTGESGTGKEVVSRAIHQMSGRSGQYVAVNCGAIAQSLMESELFGHRRGAFSGADRDHDGLVVSSDGGMLLLDELVEMPRATQVALLRVLQEQEVRPLGASRACSVDLRVVTATHADLADEVRAGRFRADLLARLSGFHLRLPSLRERREDMGLIIAALLRKLAPERAAQIRFHPAAARALVHHAWPLNIRELEQALRVALAVAVGDEIALAHLPESVRTKPASKDNSKDARHRQLLALMRTHQGNISAVARDMATSRAQVRRLTERYEIDPAEYR